MGRVAMVRGTIPAELADSARIAETIAAFVDGAEGLRWNVSCDLTPGAVLLALSKRGRKGKIAVVLADGVSRYRHVRLLLAHAQVLGTKDMLLVVLPKSGSSLAKAIASA